MLHSSRIGMPLLSVGQAQKEITHNEALILIDAVLHACCKGGPSSTPPAEPELGLCYIVSASADGAWAGHPHQLAIWTEGGWRFLPPFPGLSLTDQSSAMTWRFIATEWVAGIVHANAIHVAGHKVLGARGVAIADCSGGMTIDAEARAALAAILAALRSHGLIAE